MMPSLFTLASFFKTNLSRVCNPLTALVSHSQGSGITPRYFLIRKMIRSHGLKSTSFRLLGRFAKLSACDSSRLFSSSPDVKIVEVGPRDGLQNEKGQISTKYKVDLIHDLCKAGCSFIEAGAFVNPKWVPQMADSGDVLKNLQFEHGAKPTISCLVPNTKGLEQAIEHRDKIDEIAIFGSASEGFSQRNIACSIDESFGRFRAVVDAAKRHELPVRGYVSAVVECPYDGAIEPTQVAKVVERMMELGCYEVSLGDTVGRGTPGTIKKMLDEVNAAVPSSQLAMHCHDTYGQALANILVGLEKDIFTIDSSVAGLGGCPYAKGASGNVATEDVVYMLNGLGLSTGIDLQQCAEVGDRICTILGKESQSKAGKALLAQKQ